ncbi:MAG: AAA-like domain-containing protein [Firmicutes bacterium]|nr:AAA-like domain-containing protein [Dethiobacter sp.]MBS3887846.1 AAA-like domain-containing protein [Bacillota bacterium]
MRRFNTTGPCFPDEHYMLNAEDRLDVRGLIEQGQYFVIYAARQSGKTTLLKSLEQSINTSQLYYALYCSLEAVQSFPEPERGIPQIFNCITSAIKISGLPLKGSLGEIAASVDKNDSAVAIKELFHALCAKLNKPLVVFFDEADCLSEGTLVTFLRQLRDGYINRKQASFIHSLALVGMRSASPFNIVRTALTLHNFTRAEIAQLYSQHTETTGQIFEPGAIDKVHWWTNGQPWLVNAIALEAIENELSYDYAKLVTADMVEDAVQAIVLRRDVHIDSLLERLNEPRVRKVIEPVILGFAERIDYMSDDFMYCLNLGLIAIEDGQVVAGNRTYGEVFIRTLSFSTQFALQSSIKPVWALPDRIDMTGLLKAFQQFWRENSEIWIEKYEYKEAAPHLVLQAFLQRVINGGGDILREYASGRRRFDLCVLYAGKKYPLELKLKHSAKTEPEGLEQLGAYMDTMGEREGWLVIFDRSIDTPWENKLYWKTIATTQGTIHVVGC